MKMYGWILAAGMMGAAACDEGQGASGLSMTEGQLVEQLAAGSVRLEVELNADGTVREVEVEDGLGESTQLEDRVVGFDAAAQRLSLSLLGEVDVSAAGRYRDDDGEVLQADWLAKVEAAIALGEPVWLDARGSYVDGVFLANELRVDNDDDDIEIEADVTAADYDATTGVLTIGGKSYDISAAAIREGTDDDSSDDNGGDRDDSEISDDDSGNGSDDDSNDDNSGTDDDSNDDNSGSSSDDDNSGSGSDDDNSNTGSDDDNSNTGSDDDSNDDNSGSSSDDNSGSGNTGSDDDSSSSDDDSESGDDDLDDSDDSTDDDDSNDDDSNDDDSNDDA